MDSRFLDAKWIWHPDWSENKPGTAGGFVHFYKSIEIVNKPTDPVKIQISADTRYKLFINHQLVVSGPVKGDQHMWFYDEVDVAPYLQQGLNIIAVRVLRFYHATPFATSFPRLQSAGLVIRHHTPLPSDSTIQLETDGSWHTAIDYTTRFPVDMAEDDFLHIYEDVDCTKSSELRWVPATVLDLPASFGITAPWKLSPRIVPYPRSKPGYFKAIHNVQSRIPGVDLERMLLSRDPGENSTVLLRAGSTHHIEIEADHHSTALISFRFDRPATSGTVLRIRYSECYEDDPEFVPYIRKKGDRRDVSKKLLGPQDVYRFGGKAVAQIDNRPKYDSRDPEQEIFTPFHFRTFRFITVDIEVGKESDLAWHRIDMVLQNYPLDVQAALNVVDAEYSKTYNALWSTSIRTLENCMHDTYEDCPFYEQLQYAMDTRSSVLFTYFVSNDDRLARQAIMQLHNTYQPRIGLTASRAPAHQLQVIPHFSLYWICMVSDHYWYFGDKDFVRQFSHTCDGVLETFASWIDPELGLVRHDPHSPHWSFVDWTDSWRPRGIPPAGARTGFLSYTSMLYAYALEAASKVARAVGRAGLADEYMQRASSLVTALRTHCFDGHLFTDGLASGSDPNRDYSQHTQMWAVLSGAAQGELALSIMEQSMTPRPSNSASAAAAPITFSPASTAMSFYALRALSHCEAGLYDRLFHQFWAPWKQQLDKNLSTWEEDTVSQRSDCHAWGCAALYEFTAEVAGIQPGAPGWAEINFRPRLGLFAEFSADVPYGGMRYPGLAHVEWRTVGDGTKKMELMLKLCPDQKITFESHPRVSIDIRLSAAKIELVEDQATGEHEITYKWNVTLV